MDVLEGVVVSRTGQCVFCFLDPYPTHTRGSFPTSSTILSLSLSLSVPSPVSDATVGMDVDHPASGCKPNHPIEEYKRGIEGE